MALGLISMALLLICYIKLFYLVKDEKRDKLTVFCAIVATIFLTLAILGILIESLKGK